MAKFERREAQQQTQMAPAPQPKPAPEPVKAPEPVTPATEQILAPTAPALAVSEPTDIKKTFAGGDPKKDDEPVTHHPTKDYMIGPNAAAVNGKRQYQCDALTRRLTDFGYFNDPVKEWGANPLGGQPIPVVYTREFPGVRVLYDHFDMVPKPEIIEYKRKLAHDHNFRYLYQHNGAVLNDEEFNKQMDVEDKWLKSTIK